MSKVVIERQTSKGRWTGDAIFLGSDAMERAQEALATKRLKSFHHTFRIAPEPKPKTYEELARDRFKEKPHKPSSRWSFTDE